MTWEAMYKWFSREKAAAKQQQCGHYCRQVGHVMQKMHRHNDRGKDEFVGNNKIFLRHIKIRRKTLYG